MDSSTVGLLLTMFTSIICASNALPYLDDDLIPEACLVPCIEYSDKDACAECTAAASQFSPDLEKRSGEFYRTQRTSCHCCFLSRFTNSICCDDCAGVNGLSKRSPVLYHPLFRGGYPKKNTIYNPLLRGALNKRGYPMMNQMYNPLLRGGSNGLYNYDPASHGQYNKKSQGFYNPLLRGGIFKRSNDFSEQGFMFNPLLRGGYDKKSDVYHPFLRGGYQLGGTNGNRVL